MRKKKNMINIEIAVSRFKSGFNCCQSVFSAYSSQFGIDTNMALKLAAAFGGGIARMAETCGAVTGALMIVGLKYGATDPKDKVAKEKTYKIAQEFINQFTARNNSISCKELLNCDISTPEGMNLAHEKNLIKTICPNLIRNAAEILEQLI